MPISSNAQRGTASCVRRASSRFKNAWREGIPVSGSTSASGEAPVALASDPATIPAL